MSLHSTCKFDLRLIEWGGGGGRGGVIDFDNFTNPSFVRSSTFKPEVVVFRVASANHVWKKKVVNSGGKNVKGKFVYLEKLVANLFGIAYSTLFVTATPANTRYRVIYILRWSDLRETLSRSTKFFTLIPLGTKELRVLSKNETVNH